MKFKNGFKYLIEVDGKNKIGVWREKEKRFHFVMSVGEKLFLYAGYPTFYNGTVTVKREIGEFQMRQITDGEHRNTIMNIVYSEMEFCRDENMKIISQHIQCGIAIVVLI